MAAPCAASPRPASPSAAPAAACRPRRCWASPWRTRRRATRCTTPFDCGADRRGAGAARAARASSVDSAATDRDTYLRRPDLGRRLGPSSARSVLAGSARGRRLILLIVVADGLSSTGVAANAAHADRRTAAAGAQERLDAAARSCSPARRAWRSATRSAEVLGARAVAGADRRAAGAVVARQPRRLSHLRPRASAARTPSATASPTSAPAASAPTKPPSRSAGCCARRSGARLTGVALKDESDFLLDGAPPASALAKQSQS